MTRRQMDGAEPSEARSTIAICPCRLSGLSCAGTPSLLDADLLSLVITPFSVDSCLFRTIVRAVISGMNALPQHEKDLPLACLAVSMTLAEWSAPQVSRGTVAKVPADAGTAHAD